MYLIVYLSTNIALPELIADFVMASIPEAKQIYVMQMLQNGSITIRTAQGDYDGKVPSNLTTFLNRTSSGWYTLTETPFSSATHIGQSSLEMELERDHLLIRIDTTENTIWVLVQLRPFGPTRDKHLMSGEKKIMEHVITGMLSQLVKQQGQDRDILKQIAYSNNKAKHEVNEVRQQLDHQHKNYEVAISQFVQMIVQRLESKYGIPIRISRPFIEALKSYNRPFEGLEETLDQHLLIEMNLAMVQDEHEIVLSPSHLVPLRAATHKAEVSSEAPNLGRYTKTYKLLDRYEHAAERVHQMNLPIIGKHIGSHCKPAVSNAAITDALNKHAKKIYELFQRYPDKWPIIRGEFRSVANIMEKETLRRQSIA